MNMDEKNKGKIKTMLKKRDFLVRFENYKVLFLSYRELVETMGITRLNLEQIYTYFSLYSHPSNVSVFQYANMFSKEKEEYKDIVNFNIQLAFKMLSIFIADYITLFPNVLKTYEKMGLVEQIVINFHNYQARGHDYDINDSWKATG
jgi:hypothetical protein